MNLKKIKLTKIHGIVAVSVFSLVILFQNATTNNTPPFNENQVLQETPQSVGNYVSKSTLLDYNLSLINNNKVRYLNTGINSDVYQSNNSVLKIVKGGENVAALLQWTNNLFYSNLNGITLVPGGKPIEILPVARSGIFLVQPLSDGIEYNNLSDAARRVADGQYVRLVLRAHEVLANKLGLPVSDGAPNVITKQSVSAYSTEEGKFGQYKYFFRVDQTYPPPDNLRFDSNGNITKVFDLGSVEELPQGEVFPHDAPDGFKLAGEVDISKINFDSSTNIPITPAQIEDIKPFVEGIRNNPEFGGTGLGKILEFKYSPPTNPISDYSANPAPAPVEKSYTGKIADFLNNKLGPVANASGTTNAIVSVTSIPVLALNIQSAAGELSARLAKATSDEQRTEILNQAISIGVGGLAAAAIFTGGSIAVITLAGAVAGTTAAGVATVGIGTVVIIATIAQLSDTKFWLTYANYLLNPIESLKAVGLAAQIFFKASYNIVDATRQIYWWRLVSRNFFERFSDAVHSNPNFDWVSLANTDGKTLAAKVNAALEATLWQNSSNSSGKRKLDDANSSQNQQFVQSPKNPNLSSTPCTAGTRCTSSTTNPTNSSTLPTDPKQIIPGSGTTSQVVSAAPGGNRGNSVVVIAVPGLTAAQIEQAILNNPSILPPNPNADGASVSYVPVGANNPAGSALLGEGVAPFACSKSGCQVYGISGDIVRDFSGQPIKFDLDPVYLNAGVYRPLGLSEYTRGYYTLTLPDGRIRILTDISYAALPPGTSIQYTSYINQLGGVTVLKPNSTTGSSLPVPNGKVLPKPTLDSATNSSGNQTTGRTPATFPAMIYGEVVQ